MKLPKIPLLVPSLALVLASSAPASAEILERIVAKVNGEIITLSEFQARQFDALRQAHVDPSQAEAYLRENSPRLLQEAIDDLLLAQKAEEGATPLSDEALDQIIKQIREENGITTDEQFEARMRSEGMTLASIKRDIERSMHAQRFIKDQVDSKVSVSDAEARADYEARKQTDFAEPATVRLQEILVAARTPNAEAVARDVVARVRAGEDFAALARQYSASPTRDSGGDLGAIARKDMNAAMADAVASLEPGQVSDPVKTSDGFRILRVVERTPGRVTPFEDVKARIVDELTRKKRRVVMNRLMTKLRAEADIEDMVREIPLEPGIGEALENEQPTLKDSVAPVVAPSIAPDDEFVTTGGSVHRSGPDSATEAPLPAPTPEAARPSQ
jgi:peptidyl-prolyl cis-trans isomerase SurA